MILLIILILLLNTNLPMRVMTMNLLLSTGSTRIMTGSTFNNQQQKDYKRSWDGDIESLISNI